MKRRNSIRGIEHAETAAGIARRSPCLDGFRSRQNGVAAAVRALGLDQGQGFGLRAVGAEIAEGELAC